MKGVMLAMAVLAGLSLAESAFAFRCGNKLATEGMHKYQILADCGEPASRDYVGFERHRFIEEWVYIIEDGLKRQMYLIRFNEKGQAVKIEWLGKVE